MIDDAVGFVLAKNKHRRHMVKGELALVVAALANLLPWRPRKTLQKKEGSLSPLILTKNLSSRVDYSSDDG